MIDICLVGACGRMGRRIAEAVVKSGKTRLLSAVEAPGHPLIGQDIGQVAGISPLGVKVSADLDSSLPETGVVIDFSSPEAVEKTAQICTRHKIALVTGITGIGEKGAGTLRKAAEEIALVWAPNMSVGVNLMFKVAAEVARVLGDDFDVEIVETHHRFKKDAPSGTARRLAEVIAASLNRDLGKVACYGRKGITGERDSREIAIHALRAGDVVGEHTVVFGALGERFEITHRAHSRDTFARGAVVAAVFAARAKAGLYDMQDVLGLKT